jgi:hypothetical protein
VTEQTAEGHVTGDTKTRQPNKLKLSLAQKKAAESGALYDHVLGDVVLLLEEVGKAQTSAAHQTPLVLDVALVSELRKKYGQVLVQDSGL